MTNDHEDLEAFIGEAADYFPAAATSTIPSATQVDAWYTGPIATVMTFYSITSTLVEDALAEDFLYRWQFRKRMFGSSSRSTADVAESWQREPEFPSARTIKLIRQTVGDVHFSEG